MVLKHIKHGPVAMAVIAVLMADPVMAGGGNAVGNVADDLTKLFNDLAKPTTPPKTPKVQLDLNTPKRVPEGPTVFGTGQVDATVPDFPLPPVFNRQATGNGPDSNGLMDLFNFGARGH
ncbi:hypothetical protein TRP8649_02321 [Pelagimonas phthalicica]|uniref:Uncharacterized protein n=1 Tax=Pelagimonas phthalicica TaxID=1037362 RepID=A0A238JED8_9RHOB|nr:hypothetical protein [Pelagimonas phthalicica]TDS91159.1 hypothetical protein CLV87_2323 [Pelagimonas phthalicica]SMX28206.1 hypothetical protein TRP8649_02321 [Pelagimonas phthalicica]